MNINKSLKFFFIIAIVGIFGLTACTSSTPEDEETNRNEAIVEDGDSQIVNDVDPTAVGDGEDTVVIGLDNNTSQPTVEPTLSVGRPINLPVLFEFQARRFDMEFFYDNTQYVYYGQIQTPTPCYEIDRVVSVSETFPEYVIIDLESYATADDCEQRLTTIDFSGFVDVSRSASFRIIVNGVDAIRLLPTPTPTPRF